MSKLLPKIKAFLLNEDGTTSVEYAVMLFLIAAACIAAITNVGGENNILWENNSTEIASALN